MVKRVFSIILYVLLFGLVSIAASFYRQPIFVFLLMLLLALPVVSYYVCKYVYNQIEFSIASTTGYGFAGDTITVSLRFQNNSFFPIPDCFSRYQIESTFYPCDQEKTINFPCYAKDTFSFDLPITFARSGAYQIRLTSFSFWDYLHFFHFQKEILYKKDIVIHPHVKHQYEFDATAFGEGFDEFEESSAKGNTSSNVTDIREYIPGDRLQKIHWKLTAKINKLMVKENEQTSSNQFSVLPELYLPSPESDVLEDTLTFTQEACSALIEAGEVFFFLYYSAALSDFEKILIHNKEEYEAALLQCFYQSTYAAENLALQTLERAGLVSGTILHITHQGVEDVIS